MGIYIDKVTVYCDTEKCDGKIAVGDDSNEANVEVSEGSEDWLDKIADSISGWDIDMPPKGGFAVRCPTCSDKYWDTVREEI